jgi:hypothetical protein
MAGQSVPGGYDTLLSAEDAVRQLDRQGFPVTQVFRGYAGAVR